jgi:tripartite-type tricarboxylate transporter receptor subunit TctC
MLRNTVRLGMRAFVLAVVALSLCHAAAFAQAWPSKSIRMIVPFPPGGGTDYVGRVVAQELTKALGQQVIVDNRAGANGIVGLEALRQSPPDGYTISAASCGPLSINPSIYKKLPHDILRDFAPITNAVNTPLLLVTHPSLKVNTVGELIALAKAKPGALNYASPGVGNSGHLAGALFNHMTGLDIVHVPYKGQGEVMTDLLAGKMPMILFSSIPTVLPFVKEGRLRALAIGELKRLPALADIPTVAESGVPGYEAYSWVGIVAPANTPNNIIVRLNSEIGVILRKKEIVARVLEQGGVPVGDSPEHFGAYLKSEIAKWGAVVRMANITPE